MATSYTHTLIFNFRFLSTLITLSNCNFSEDFLESITTTRMEKTTHLHFYFQEILSGKNPTAVRDIGKGLGFGTTFIIDDAWTKGPNRNSRVVGRAQGMYSAVAQNNTAFLMTITFVFTEGKYGSGVSVLGRNHVLDDVREMPIVGESGLFRFARGMPWLTQFGLILRQGMPLWKLEYNVFVRHY